MVAENWRPGLRCWGTTVTRGELFVQPLECIGHTATSLHTLFDSNWTKWSNIRVNVKQIVSISLTALSSLFQSLLLDSCWFCSLTLMVSLCFTDPLKFELFSWSKSHSYRYLTTQICLITNYTSMTLKSASQLTWVMCSRTQTVFTVTSVKVTVTVSIIINPSSIFLSEICHKTRLLELLFQP